MSKLARSAIFFLTKWQNNLWVFMPWIHPWLYIGVFSLHIFDNFVEYAESPLRKILAGPATEMTNTEVVICFIIFYKIAHSPIISHYFP